MQRLREPGHTKEGGGAAAPDPAAAPVHINRGWGPGTPSLTARLDEIRERIRAKLAALELVWRAEAEALLAVPDLGKEDRRDLRMILRWRKPGRRGLEIVADIKRRVSPQ